MVKKQKLIDVRKLGYQQALDILTGGSEDPTKYQHLPIDDWLRSAKVLSTNELIANGVSCLKTAIRIAVAGAAFQASQGAEIEIAAPNYLTSNNPKLSMRERAKQLASLIPKIKCTKKQLGQLSRQFDSFDLIMPFAQRFCDRQDPRLSARAGIVAADAKNAVIDCNRSLEILLQFANLELRRCLPLGRASNPWNVGFVIGLGIFYRRVTGKNPHHNSFPFLDLVAAAYTSLGATNEQDWDGFVRTACRYMKNRPDWDRWDRSCPPPPGPSAKEIMKRILGRNVIDFCKH